MCYSSYVNEHYNDHLELENELDEATRAAAIAAAERERRRMTTILRSLSPEKQKMAARIAQTVELRRAIVEYDPDSEI